MPPPPEIRTSLFSLLLLPYFPFSAPDRNVKPPFQPFLSPSSTPTTRPPSERKRSFTCSRISRKISSCSSSNSSYWDQNQINRAPEATIQSNPHASASSPSTELDQARGLSKTDAKLPTLRFLTQIHPFLPAQTPKTDQKQTNKGTRSSQKPLKRTSRRRFLVRFSSASSKSLTLLHSPSTMTRARNRPVLPPPPPPPPPL